VDAYDARLLELMKELGDILLEDDKDDVGKFSFPGHPSPFHHWQVGAALKYGAELIRWSVAITEVQRVLGADDVSIDRLEAQLYAITNGASGTRTAGTP